VAAALEKEKPVALVLIGGGVRSGKSRYAIARARQAGGRLACMVTAQPLDSEMKERIAAHKRQRGDDFVTIEEPLDLAGALRAAAADAVVIDCLTLWLSNLVHAAGLDLDRHVDAALAALRETTAQVFVVTNEIGSGVVPVTALGRAFRDRAGEVNQRFAAAADEVYLMVFGQPLRVK
jgi:adenosylcobinamide kinase/adenosylcobinamide-phosphate guanylyltransferase